MTMSVRIKRDADVFYNHLLSCTDECSSMVYENCIHIRLVNGMQIPLHNIRSPVLVCEVRKIEPEGTHENSESEKETDLLEDNVLQGLTIVKARQLLSYYVMSQNPSMSNELKSALKPIWLRCDMSDSERTCWLGAETVCIGEKITGVKLYNIRCTGPVVWKASLNTVNNLKDAHSRSHHPTTMVTQGFARYNLFGSSIVENTVIESQSSVTVDFWWNDVENILQTPPLSSAATLNIRIVSGDMRSPIFHLYKELEFLQILADGLRTGVTEWVEPMEAVSAVDLTKALIEDLQTKTKAIENQISDRSEVLSTETPSVESFVFNTILKERGHLDFVEQLWVKMWRSVTSYQDILECLKLVIDALRYGDIKPWVHQDSSSFLSKLVLQSYSKPLESVSLVGLLPIRILLEMGLDKMRKDYINCLISQELTTLKALSYYIDTEVDLLEQAVRVKKLHHLLETVVTCSTFLSLSFEHLFALTQSCLRYYEVNPYDEDHQFQLQIRPALIKTFYQSEHPITWQVEVLSGQGPKEVRTSLQLCDRCAVEHLTLDSTDLSFRRTVDGDCEEPTYFLTMASCSLISFV